MTDQSAIAYGDGSETEMGEIDADNPLWPTVKFYAELAVERDRENERLRAQMEGKVMTDDDFARLVKLLGAMKEEPRGV